MTPLRDASARRVPGCNHSRQTSRPAVCRCHPRRVLSQGHLPRRRGRQIEGRNRRCDRRYGKVQNHVRRHVGNSFQLARIRNFRLALTTAPGKNERTRAARVLLAAAVARTAEARERTATSDARFGLFCVRQKKKLLPHPNLGPRQFLIDLPRFTVRRGQSLALPRGPSYRSPYHAVC
jgi:hypothetical protein